MDVRRVARRLDNKGEARKGHCVWNLTPKLTGSDEMLSQWQVRGLPIELAIQIKHLRNGLDVSSARFPDCDVHSGFGCCLTYELRGVL